jgi:hypothetical protein
MNTNQLMSRLGLIGVLLPGCYGVSEPIPMGPRIVRCASDADCPGDEVCLDTVRWPYAICYERCDPRVSSRCANGALCDFVRVGAEFEILCQPGAGLPDTFPVTEPCISPGECPFGETCWVNPLEPAVRAMCQPICGIDSDCEPGEGCYAGRCLQICDIRVPDSCPEGYGCNYTGECKREEELADCPPTNVDGITPPNVPNNCPIGTICLGGDERFECDSRSDQNQLMNCPPDQQRFITDRCYPRSDLRPIR